MVELKADEHTWLQEMVDIQSATSGMVIKADRDPC